MSDQLPSRQRDTAREITRKLQASGYEAFWVGGCVRDSLLGRQPQDYDIATSARPGEVEALFPHTVPVGRQFGVILVLEDSIQFQVATFRADADYVDGRRPTAVTFTDARADASRRDFTVNGLFFDPIRNQLHDWVEGQADIAARLVRTIGDPEVRFAEDHLRILRAVRFAAQLDFEIAPSTLSAVQRNAATIRQVSAERVRDELLRLFRPPHAARGLDLLDQAGLLREVLPEVAAFRGCEQGAEYHPEGNVYQHVRLMLSLLPPDSDPMLAWAVLLHDVAKPVTATRDAATGAIHFYGHEKVGAEMAEALLHRLRFPKKQIDQVVAVVRQHMQFKDVPEMRKSTLRRLLMRPTYPLELELHRLDCLGSHGMLDHYEYLRRAAEDLSQMPGIRPPLLRGDDLLGLGLTPGPRVGELLAEIREKQLLDELTTPEQALEFARGHLKAED